MSEHDPTMPVGEALRRVQAMERSQRTNAQMTTVAVAGCAAFGAPTMTESMTLTWDSEAAVKDADALAVLIGLVECSDDALLATNGVGWAWKYSDGTFAADSCYYGLPPKDDLYRDGGSVRVSFRGIREIQVKALASGPGPQQEKL